MASVIKAGNATDGVQVTSDNTGILELKTGTGAGTTAVTIGTNQAVTFAQSANLPNTFGFKNRIINGNMVIDQRNAGASVTPTAATYSLDRWNAQVATASTFSLQQSSTAASGFIKSLLVTSLAATSVGSTASNTVEQYVEGLNCADLGWGAAGAASVTLSFWVRSSLTGTFGGCVQNSDNTRSYVFSYTISAANTWEQKTVTIAGDTSGTWLTTNGIGIKLRFSLGNGSTLQTTAGSWSGSNLRTVTGETQVLATNGATFYITGVQLEKGSTATSFDYRPYGTELQLCQRYFIRYGNGGAAYTVGAPYLAYPLFDQNTIPSGACFAIAQLPVELRTTNPTFTAYKAFNGSTADLSNTNWQPFYTTFNNQRSVAIQKITNSMTTNQTTIVLDFDLSAEL